MTIRPLPVLTRQPFISGGFEQRRNASPREGRGHHSGGVARHDRIALDLARSQHERLSRRCFQQKSRDAAATPRRGNVETQDRPRTLWAIASQGSHPFEARMQTARSERAPPDRLVSREGQDAVHLAVFQELLKGRSVLRPFHSIPELAALRHAPPHAPAAAACAVGAEELLDRRPVIFAQQTCG